MAQVYVLDMVTAFTFTFSNFFFLILTESLTRAKSLADKAVVSSDLSDGDTIKPKRKRKAPEFYQSGAVSSDEEVESRPLKSMRISTFSYSLLIRF